MTFQHRKTQPFNIEKHDLSTSKNTKNTNVYANILFVTQKSQKTQKKDFMNEILIRLIRLNSLFLLIRLIRLNSLSLLIRLIRLNSLFLKLVIS